MSDVPLVSVVTISFRDLSGLRATIDSTRSQDHPRIEHLVIDGGSGQEVETLLTRSSLAYWQSRADGGRYDAMNQGISRSRGDLIWFMHSADRFADTGSVSRAVRELSATGSAVRKSWAFGGATLVSGDRDGHYWGTDRFRRRRFELGVAPIPHQAALFGAELVESVGGYSTTFGLAADHLFMLQMSRLATPVVIDEPLCLFDTAGAGSVRSQRDHFRDVRAAWAEAGVLPFRSRTLSVAVSYAVQAEAAAKRAARQVASRVGER